MFFELNEMIYSNDIGNFETFLVNFAKNSNLCLIWCRMISRSFWYLWFGRRCFAWAEKGKKPAENSKFWYACDGDMGDVIIMSHISNESPLSGDPPVKISDRYDHQVALESNLKIWLKNALQRLLVVESIWNFFYK